ncbi:hypothetical protein [Clostridium culturomicium]|uniref:hypothetical protein n=1 Tax=Clostridium culturomicium TaxID=1499683 RepID=UPI003857AD27
MIIYIKEEQREKGITIYIPRCFIGLGASIMTRVLSSKGIGYIERSETVKEVKPLSKEQAKEIRNMLKYLNKNYKGLTIVDVQSKNEAVKIII